MKRLIVITGLSGAGKSTAAKHLDDEFGIPKVITATTREPRKHEKNGVDYFFMKEKDFISADKIEETTYCGYHYGILRETIDNLFKIYNTICVVTDSKGIDNLREIYGKNMISVFINANTDELERRMIARGDDKEKIKLRLTGKEFREEQFSRLFCDYEIMNEFSDKFFIKELNMLIRRIHNKKA